MPRCPCCNPATETALASQGVQIQRKTPAATFLVDDLHVHEAPLVVNQVQVIFVPVV
eukprot:COSAG06_NODE_50678_length_317_cov_0.692661_1_plen_56_part_10